MSFPADMGSFRRVRSNASFLNHLSGIGGAHAQGEMRPGVRQAEFEASAEEVEAERLCTRVGIMVLGSIRRHRPIAPAQHQPLAALSPTLASPLPGAGAGAGVGGVCSAPLACLPRCFTLEIRCALEAGPVALEHAVRMRVRRVAQLAKSVARRKCTPRGVESVPCTEAKGDDRCPAGGGQCGRRCAECCGWQPRRGAGGAAGALRLSSWPFLHVPLLAGGGARLGAVRGALHRTTRDIGVRTAGGGATRLRRGVAGRTGPARVGSRRRRVDDQPLWGVGSGVRGGARLSWAVGIGFNQIRRHAPHSSARVGGWTWVGGGWAWQLVR